MKKAAISLMLFTLLFGGFTSCKHLDVKVDRETLTALEISIISTVGYLIVLNNPQYGAVFYNWYRLFKSYTELTDIQNSWQDGVNQLTDAVIEDPYVKMQVDNALKAVKIDLKGPRTIEDIAKYKLIVDSFMSGVQAKMPYLKLEYGLTTLEN